MFEHSRTGFALVRAWTLVGPRQRLTKELKRVKETINERGDMYLRIADRHFDGYADGTNHVSGYTCLATFLRATKDSKAMGSIHGFQLASFLAAQFPPNTNRRTLVDLHRVSSSIRQMW